MSRTTIGPVEFRQCAASIGDSNSPRDIEAAFSFAMTVQRHSPWWIGDMMNAGLLKFGHSFYQAMDSIGYSWAMVERFAGVAGKVPETNRHPNLSWSHHAMVANLPMEMQKTVLDHAEVEGLTCKELEQYIASLVRSKTHRKA